MDYGFAFVGGILAKVYDDGVDNEMITNYQIIELLKGSQWILLTLLSHSDFNFSSIFYLSNFLNHLGNKGAFDTAYEKSLLILYPLFLFTSFSSAYYFILNDVVLILLYLFLMFVEPMVISEEFSYKKMISRLFLSATSSCILFCSFYFPISPSILKIIYYCLGYALISAGVQAYLLRARLVGRVSHVVPELEVLDASV